MTSIDRRIAGPSAAARLRALAFAVIAAFISLAALGSSGALARSWPSKPVRVVIGVPPGGLADTLARGIAAELSKMWGQAVVVESRPGASDAVAADAVAKSSPDGYTLYQPNSTVLMVNTFLRSKLPFNPRTDFTPVIALVRTSDVLLAKAQLPARSLAELVSLARSKPGALNYGSFGVGSAAHLDAEKLSLAAGIKLTHVPYKGGPDVMKALLSGEIDLGFTGLTAAIPLIRQGRVKALAWGAEQRSAAIPEVPTLRESGYDFDTGGWLAWLVPSGTPRAVVEKISADTSKVLAERDFEEKFIRKVGLEPLNVQAAPFAKLMKDTQEQYAKLFKSMNIKLE